jgi:hypothetical protein
MAIERNHVRTTRAAQGSTKTRKTIFAVYGLAGFVIFERFVIE